MGSAADEESRLGTAGEQWWGVLGTVEGPGASSCPSAALSASDVGRRGLISAAALAASVAGRILVEVSVGSFVGAAASLSWIVRSDWPWSKGLLSTKDVVDGEGLSISDGLDKRSARGSRPAGAFPVRAYDGNVKPSQR